MVAVPVAIPILYNNGVTVAVFVSVTNYGTITVAVPIMSGANCYATGPTPTPTSSALAGTAV